MIVKRFEELDCWNESRKLVNCIYMFTQDKNFSRDFRFRDQIQSAAVSAMSNIAEGFERHSRPDFTRFLRIALSSATEVQSQLYIALDQKYVTQKEFENGYEQCKKVKSLISGFIRYLSQPTQKLNSYGSTAALQDGSTIT